MLLKHVPGVWVDTEEASNLLGVPSEGLSEFREAGLCMQPCCHLPYLTLCETQAVPLKYPIKPPHHFPYLRQYLHPQETPQIFHYLTFHFYPSPDHYHENLDQNLL